MLCMLYYSFRLPTQRYLLIGIFLFYNYFGLLHLGPFARLDEPTAYRAGMEQLSYYSRLRYVE